MAEAEHLLPPVHPGGIPGEDFMKPLGCSANELELYVPAGADCRDRACAVDAELVHGVGEGWTAVVRRCSFVVGRRALQDVGKALVFCGMEGDLGMMMIDRGR
jgi:hypothetical protein